MIKVDDIKIEPGYFPDGAILVKHAADYSERGRRSAHEIVWLFENNEEMITLMYLTRHLQSHGVMDIGLCMPYIPNARQDRVKGKEDIFTLKYFAEFINSLKFSTVSVLDPHSSVSTALINNICTNTPSPYIKESISRIEKETGETVDILFFPDEGAMKRYSGVVNLPYAFGIKSRDWKTGEIKGLDVVGSTELIRGASVLIVDDICSRGGTFLHSARKLKELGSDKIYLYVSHCENTILDGELLTSGLIKRVYTTGSIFTKEHKMVDVIRLYAHDWR